MGLKYKHSAKTLAEWTELNPVILENEIVIEKVTWRIKIGNGVDQYLDLPYGYVGGVPGRGIIENGVVRTSGNGDPGTTDTYTITFTDATTTTFTVVNGANGTGATVVQTPGPSTGDVMSQNTATSLTESEAAQLIKNINPDLTFSGFVNSLTVTPAHTANKAYITYETGTILGISAFKGQVIIDDGTTFTTAWSTLLQKQKNKAIQALAVDGKLYDSGTGNIATSATYAITGRQPVLPSTQYTLWCVAAPPSIHFWDINGAWLGKNPTIAANSTARGKSFTTPANCFFVGFYITKAAFTFQQFKDSIQLELGTAETAYEAPAYKLPESIMPTNMLTNILTLQTNVSDVNSSILKLTSLTESEAAQLIKNINPDLTFSGFVNSLTVTPAHTANKAYITYETGTILGISAFKGQVIIDDGTTFTTAWSTLLQKQKNKAIQALAVDGKLYDNGTGNIATSASNAITGRQPVLPSTQYTLWCVAAPPYIHFWDINGAWLGKNPTIAANSTARGKSFTTPANCFFVGFYITKGAFTFQQFKDSIQLELGTAETAYEAPAYKLPESILPTSTLSNVSSLLSNVSDLTTKLNYSNLTILKSGEYIYVRSSFNATYDIVQRFRTNISNFTNQVVNFYNTYLILKAALNTSTVFNAGIIIQSGNDDACPISYNGSYMGANHGYYKALDVTVTSHDKTTVDIGSEWVDGLGHKFYIVRIISATHLIVLSENIGTSDLWNSYITISGNLTHSASATHTATITVSSSVQSMLLPNCKNHTYKILLNGKTDVVSDGVYYSKYIDIIDQYDIVSPYSMLTNLIASVGTTYTDEQLHTAFQNGTATVFNQICYRIQKNGALQIIYGWRNYAQINLAQMGFMQAAVLPATAYPKLYLYMPKVLPVTVGAKTWDLTTVESWDTAPTNILAYDSAAWEVPTSPPDRMVEYIGNTGKDLRIGFAMGYDLTKGIGTNRKDLVNRAWWYPTTKKSYPFGIDSKLGNVAANTWFSCIAYRIFFDCKSTDKGSATNFYYYELGNSIIVVFDYHTSVSFDVLNLPPEYIGMTVTVVEKSSNVTIHTSEVMQNGITVSVGSGTYGYCTLKLT